ncbi:MAG: polyphenol oxidase family protein [Erysipelotrichia bacterium]|nr:polyphenol oxidase family protein [Erysipelotrichia bacterium]
MRFFLTMKPLVKLFPLSEKCVALTTTIAFGNLGYQVAGGKGVYERRKHLAASLNIPLSHFVFVYQSHSDKIIKVEQSDLGKGVKSFESGLDCDGLYTYLNAVPLCIFHADCVPLFFIDETTNLVGIIHAGFEGTLKRVVYKSIKKIIEEEKIAIANLKFYIGPYRRVDHFIVNESVRQEVSDAGYACALSDHKFDNGLAVKKDLYELGVKQSQITDSNLDTVTDHEFYCAYRTHLDGLKNPAGRMVSLIYLK